MTLYDYYKNECLDYVQADGHVDRKEFREKCFNTHRSIPVRIEYELDKNKEPITVGYYKLYGSQAFNIQQEF